MTQWTALYRWKMYSLEFDYANMDNVWSGLSSTLFLSSPTPWPPGIPTPTCQPVCHDGYFFFFQIYLSSYGACRRGNLNWIHFENQSSRKPKFNQKLISWQILPILLWKLLQIVVSKGEEVRGGKWGGEGCIHRIETWSKQGRRGKVGGKMRKRGNDWM